MNRFGMLLLAASLLLPATGAGVGAQEATETESDEADCIAGLWPEGPPASIVELTALFDEISTACVGAVTMYAQNPANIRSEPSLTADKAGSLAWGEEVQAACGIEGDAWKGSSEWCSVEGGYVHALLLDADKPAAPPVAAAPAPADTSEEPAGDEGCAGYNKCINACRYEPGATFTRQVWGLNSQQGKLEKIENCQNLTGTERFPDPCGGGGTYSEFWDDSGLWMRWKCPS